MSSKNTLLAGASGIALAVLGLPGAAHAGLSPYGAFTFGYTGATIDPTSTITPPLAGAVGALSSQINSQLNLDASVLGTTFKIDAGSVASASPADVNSNAVQAISVNNQFTGSTGSSTYAVNPTNIPTGGAAVLGTSQLNTSMASQSANVGAYASGGTPGGNSATFTAASNFAGASVNLNNNSFVARAIGNTVNSAISGALPNQSIATAAASIDVSGVSVVTPVGSSITMTAPIAVTNVQQNVANTSAATLSASNINSLVSASFNGVNPGSSGTTTSGYLNGTVSTSVNTISASASGNLSSLNNSILPGGSPVLSGGLGVMNAQGNQASGGGTLSITADVSNPAIYVQAFDSTSGSSGSLTTLTNANAVLNANTISSRVTMNDATQILAVDPLVYAGSASSAGSNTTTTYIYPVDSAGSNPTTTLTASADYVNASVQRNVSDSAGTLSATTNVESAVIGFFGGVSSGTVSVQGNAISATALGNTNTLTTSLGRLAADATSVTAALQHNDNLSLTAQFNQSGILSHGVFLRISDANTVTVGSDTSASLSFVSNSTTTVTPGFNNATLNIGGTSPALGNTVSATVIGNNATAAALLGTVSPSGSTTASSVSATLTNANPILTPAGTQASVDAQHTVTVVQQNLNLGLLEAFYFAALSTDGALYQITANGGLANSTATIGYNNLRSTTAGNVAQAAATLTGAAGNLLNGGIGVFTAQGNQGGTIQADIGKIDYSATPPAYYTPGVDIASSFINDSTAQVVNNNLAALAAGNSASGNLTFGAYATVMWIKPDSTPEDGTEYEGMYFSFGEYNEDNEPECDSFGVPDDRIVYYCEDERELKAFMTAGVEDFVVTSYELEYDDRDIEHALLMHESEINK